jgi:homoserine dehydrogenase
MLMIRKVNVAVIGLGTVGSGVVKILNEKKEKILERFGFELKISECADLNRDRYSQLVSEGYDCGSYYEDAFELLEKTGAEIVVELIGGYEPARSIMLKALGMGKSVVTANKEVVSRAGYELFEAAEKSGVDFYFEASVGGGIPIIRPLKEMLAANNFRYIAGIVNGTTNFILTRMSSEGLTFEESLKTAQELGYAEPNPQADIEGDDAQSKIAILASIAFNSRVSKEQVYKEGITTVTRRDIAYADELGYRIKLIAFSKSHNDGIFAFVRPALVPKNHPLALVDNVYNAIFVSGDSCGDLMFYGEGAGSLAAGSSVVGDIIASAQALVSGRRGFTGCGCFRDLEVLPIENLKSRYYVNLRAEDRPGVLAKIAGCFGDSNVSIASVIQKESDGKSAYIVFMTHETEEGNLRRALRLIERLDVVEKLENVFIVLNEELVG